MLIPYVVLDSPDVLGLSAIAFKLLVMMFKQFNGGNNGDFSAPFSKAKEWGIRSEATLCKALKELVSANLIVRTRDPIRDRQNPRGQCSLYGVTWLAIHECGGKLDINPTVQPLRSFSMDKFK